MWQLHAAAVSNLRQISGDFGFVRDGRCLRNHASRIGDTIAASLRSRWCAPAAPARSRGTKMSLNIRKHLLASTVLIGLTALAPVAHAQDATPATEEESPESGDIIVTGSLIRNPNLEASSPINVVSETELQLRSITSSEQVLRELPGVVPGVGSQTNNGNGGFATVNLRGLGAQRNLVLLDGDRLVTANQLGTVDPNNIPVALVQRAEVLTGGASTTYGADAVSGVVNFITRKDFAGVLAQATNQITEQGDGNIFTADLTIGANFDDGRGNAVLSLGYQEADPIYQGARDISIFEINGLSGRGAGSSATSVPTTVTIGGVRSQLNPAGTLLVPEYAGFNFNPFNIFQTPFKRFNIYAAANYEVSDTIELYTRAAFSKNEVATIIAPSGIFGEALTIPGNNPYLPAGVRDQLCTSAGIALGTACNTNAAIPLSAVFRRTVELGPRISDYTTTFFDYRAGARINISDTTRLDVSASYGESDLVQIQSGYVLRSRVQQALNANNTTTCTNTANGCVPLNLFGAQGSILPEQAAFIAGESTITIKNQLSQVRAILTGDVGSIFSSGAEPVSYAIGAEYRDYGYERLPDVLAAIPGELGGAGGAVPRFAGSYDVKEVFGEVIAPIIADTPFFHSLTLEAGIRYSSYNVEAASSPSFDSVTWKAGLSWEPVQDIKLRGNYQRAVRAPNINELFSPRNILLTNLAIDPCQGTRPVGNAGLTAVCLAQGAPAATIGRIPAPPAGQAQSQQGGDVNIQPETADTFTIGAVISPGALFEGFTLSIDYYNIIVNDAITAPTPADAINACFGATPATVSAAAAQTAACTNIRRSPADGSLSGSPTNTFGLPLLLSNTGRLATDGIDLTANYTRTFGDIGLNLTFIGNWTNNLRFRSLPTSVNRQCVGFFSVNCSPDNGQIAPEFSFQQRTTVSFGPADVSLLWRYIHPVEYEPGLTPLFSGTITGTTPLVGTTENFNTIGAYHYFDLSTRFRMNENFELIGTVTNLFDRDPPLTGSNVGSTGANSGNTFPATYDVIGRRFSITGRLTF
ncbi:MULTISPECIES: TonB-dependent receptor domain-containing protein [unclassified Sphingomonas]|uniref:TonB-dependent receptor domain-containing protein n=1 Tax=unclassified Sphingomonas TaxID=196159 RepID=UPI002F91062A